MDVAPSQNEANVDVIRRWFKEVWCEGREETIDELFHLDVKAHGLGDAPIDFDGFKAMWRGMRETFSGMQVEVHDAFASGDLAACRFTAKGHHTGPGLGIDAKGIPISSEGQCITRIENGQIVEGWNVIDMAAVYRQVGLLNL